MVGSGQCTMTGRAQAGASLTEGRSPCHELLHSLARRQASGLARDAGAYGGGGRGEEGRRVESQSSEDGRRKYIIGDGRGGVGKSWGGGIGQGGVTGGGCRVGRDKVREHTSE